MGKKLYVGNLAFSVTEDSLLDYFKAAGEVESARLITDRASGRSKGFGFVEMATEEDAQKAIEMFHQQSWEGRPLTVSEARPPEPRRGGGGGFGGGGGGRGAAAVAGAVECPQVYQKNFFICYSVDCRNKAKDKDTDPGRKSYSKHSIMVVLQM